MQRFPLFQTCAYFLFSDCVCVFFGHTFEFVLGTDFALIKICPQFRLDDKIDLFSDKRNSVGDGKWEMGDVSECELLMVWSGMETCVGSYLNFFFFSSIFAMIFFCFLSSFGSLGSLNSFVGFGDGFFSCCGDDGGEGVGDRVSKYP
eukprot:TRINITY_DN3778_c0_g1_i2.p2 TRINITY_DN3778_c0_g1~~TRINITY_DN3778_c0_g1_i2.p2  ORF type:complete len:147 (-),score=8.44 TRINITY_DN3778_c0_g1_i2:52-492(-)